MPGQTSQQDSLQVPLRRLSAAPVKHPDSTNKAGSSRTQQPRRKRTHVPPGVAATSVYLHFPDVEQLKMAVVERGFARLDESRDTASGAITDPVQALLARCR